MCSQSAEKDDGTRRAPGEVGNEREGFGQGERLCLEPGRGELVLWARVFMDAGHLMHYNMRRTRKREHSRSVYSSET